MRSKVLRFVDDTVGLAQAAPADKGEGDVYKRQEVKVLKANILLGEGKIDEAEQLLDSIEDKEDLANIVDVSYMYIDMGDVYKRQGL